MKVFPFEALSFDELKSAMRTYLESLPDQDKWKDFFDSGAGFTLVELMAGFGAYLSFHSMSARREVYSQHAQMYTSMMGIANNQGYPVNRVSAPLLRIQLDGTQESVLWSRSNPIGTFQGRSIVLPLDRSLPAPARVSESVSWTDAGFFVSASMDWVTGVKVLVSVAEGVSYPVLTVDGLDVSMNGSTAYYVIRVNPSKILFAATRAEASAWSPTNATELKVKTGTSGSDVLRVTEIDKPIVEAYLGEWRTYTLVATQTQPFLRLYIDDLSVDNELSRLRLRVNGESCTLVAWAEEMVGNKGYYQYSGSVQALQKDLTVSGEHAGEDVVSTAGPTPSGGFFNEGMVGGVIKWDTGETATIMDLKTGSWVKVSPSQYVGSGRFSVYPKPDSTKVLIRTSAEGVFLIFGDGILGRSLSQGEVVVFDYLSTEGPLVTGTSGEAIRKGATWAIGGIDTSNSLSAVTVVTPGYVKDGIEKLRMVLPGYFAARRRMLTQVDHEAVLLSYEGVVSAACRRKDQMGDGCNCCVAELVPLFWDQHIPLTPEVGVILGYLDQFKIVGEQLQIVRPVKTILQVRMAVVITDPLVACNLEARILAIIKKQLYQLGRTFHPGELLSEVGGIKGVLRVYLKSPSADRPLAFNEYLGFDDGLRLGASPDEQYLSEEVPAVSISVEDSSFDVASDWVTGYEVEVSGTSLPGGLEPHKSYFVIKLDGVDAIRLASTLERALDFPPVHVVLSGIVVNEVTITQVAGLAVNVDGRVSATMIQPLLLTVTQDESYVQRPFDPDATVGYYEPQPDVPTGLVASKDQNGKVKVWWNWSGGAATYDLYRHTENNVSYFDDPDKTPIVLDSVALGVEDVPPSPGVNYYYWVRAKNNAGVSGYSAPAYGRYY